MVTWFFIYLVLWIGSRGPARFEPNTDFQHWHFCSILKRFVKIASIELILLQQYWHIFSTLSQNVEVEIRCWAQPAILQFNIAYLIASVYQAYNVDINNNKLNPFNEQDTVVLLFKVVVPSVGLYITPFYGLYFSQFNTLVIIYLKIAVQKILNLLLYPLT